MLSLAKLTAKPASTASATLGAVDALAQTLSGDMRSVNGVILKNLGSNVPLVTEVAQYLIAAGGKRLRPMLTVAAARLCGDTGTGSHALAAAVEFIHSASLLHDDVVDESHLRRGQPSANDAFGNQASVLVGDFLFARAFELMVASGSLAVLEILARASAQITEGEVLQLSLAGNIDTAEQDYMRVITAKTAALFAAATETGAILGGGAHRTALHDFGFHFGLAFQMIDDVIDYTAPPESFNKTLGDDFREGKLTLPVILAIAAADAGERTFWQTALSGADHPPELFRDALTLMHKHNIFDFVRARAVQHADLARAALATAPDHPLRAQLLDVLDDCTQRTA